jgi:hypothetical protein
VDRERAIGLLADVVVTERDVRYREIVIVGRPLQFFVAVDVDLSAAVERLRNAPVIGSSSVAVHAVLPATLSGVKPDEVADAGRGLERQSSIEAQMIQCPPNAPNDVR